MEDKRRSSDPSLYVGRNRGPSGCLIVKRKGGDVGGTHVGSGSHKVFESKKYKKRQRLEFGDYGSGDDVLAPPRRKLGEGTIRVCNGMSGYDEGGVEDGGRKRSREADGRRNEVSVIARNGEDLSDRKRNKLDVFDFDEYDGSDGGLLRRKHFEDAGLETRRFFGSVTRGRSGSESEYETGSSHHHVGFDRRKSMYYEKGSGRDHGKRHPISFLRDQHDSDEPIRVQGKNGVLKVMVKKKKMDGGRGSFNSYEHLEPEENRRGQRAEDPVKRNASILHSLYSESRSVGKASPVAATSSSKNGKVSDRDSEDSHPFLKLGPKNAEPRSSMKTPVAKNKKVPDMDSEDSDTSLKLGLGQKKVEVRKSLKKTSSSGEKTPGNQLPPSGSNKDTKVKRGTGTEKQKLRERIREMLQQAGWHIDYRPRRNRDYLDAVYINPSGTAYWSIIKAYEALQKQQNEEIQAKAAADGSPFTPLSDEVLSQLTRKTRKKMEKEKKRKQKVESESDDAGETTARKSLSTRADEESMDSGSHEEKLSSFIKHGTKTSKGRSTGDGSVGGNSKGQSSAHVLDVSTEEPSEKNNNHQARTSRKLGRCTLLVRSSNEGLNSDGDDFVPYDGKRTILSWLIDSGTVELSQKVRYMNRRRTKVMLEGWVTKDGIHCGCCSKILTVSKFEIHAGSKLRQPFQNIYVDSGVSLFDCQVQAWNKQESAEKIGFHSVHIDGDDPNDDTCGICGDGGDLICCDTCPSTFHQSCLDIEMLPLGDWHCPNCTCKLCGLASETSSREDDKAGSALPICSLCSRKYHNSCVKEMDLPTDANSSAASFCGKKCSELFEQLQRYLGVKHELEAGFSWSLVHRTDVVSDTGVQGLPQRVECNCKLAVALSVMDECFLPIIDRRSGINIIRNVLYNCGSNFNRLNYGGFYAVILERGDEMIATASIRFHGMQLAEMPFIGTRHIYRRQGMCRRLFGAIESVLSTLKIEKLIIPAISELTHTWTEVFGFTNLDKTLKQELKSLNMLVFPGIDMLLNELLEDKTGRIRTSNTNEAEILKSEAGQSNTAEVADDIDSSDKGQFPECDNGSELDSESNDEAEAEAATANNISQSPELRVNLNHSSMLGSSSDAIHELRRSASLEPAINTDSESREEMNGTALEDQSPGLEVNLNHNSMFGSPSGASHELKRSASLEPAINTDSESRDKMDETAFDDKSPGIEVNLNHASTLGSPSDAAHELERSASPEPAINPDCQSGEKMGETALDDKSPGLQVNLNHASTLGSPSDASHELQRSASPEPAFNPDCESGEKMDETALDDKSPGVEVNLNHTSMLDSPSDASYELKRSASPEPDCESRDKMDETALDDKSPSKNNSLQDGHDINKKVNSDSFVEENTQSAVRGDMVVGDSASLNLSVTSDTVSVRIQVPTSDNVTQLGSDERITNSNANHSMETMPDLSCPAVDNTKSCEGGDLGDVHVENVNLPCPEAVPSEGETTVGKCLGEINETPGVSVCKSDDANNNFEHVNSKVDKGIVSNGGSELIANLEAVYEAKNDGGVPKAVYEAKIDEVSVPKVLEDGCQTDVGDEN